MFTPIAMASTRSFQQRKSQERPIFKAPIVSSIPFPPRQHQRLSPLPLQLQPQHLNRRRVKWKASMEHRLVKLMPHALRRMQCSNLTSASIQWAHPIRCTDTTSAPLAIWLRVVTAFRTSFSRMIWWFHPQARLPGIFLFRPE